MKIPIHLLLLALLTSCDQQQGQIQALQHQQRLQAQESGRTMQDLMAQIAALQKQTTDMQQILVRLGEKGLSTPREPPSATPGSAVDEKLLAGLTSVEQRLTAVEQAVKLSHDQTAAAIVAPSGGEQNPVAPGGGTKAPPPRDDGKIRMVFPPQGLRGSGAPNTP